MKILLINPNEEEPGIPPIGLEYTAESLKRAGHAVDLCDFQFQSKSTLQTIIRESIPEVIGITVRNIDTAHMFNSKGYIEQLSDIISSIRDTSDAVTVLGGSGFSIMPEEIMEFCGADFGIVGEGEITFPALLQNLKSPSHIPNLYYKVDSGKVIQTESKTLPINDVPVFKRDFVDYNRYYEAYGSFGDNSICNIQTKRGCNKNCIYCAEPQVIGRKIRFRPTEKIINELETLVSYGIKDKLFIVDSEFNVSNDHAYEISKAIIDSKLKIKWSCYMTPDGVDKDLIKVIQRAGCEMIFWSVESASEKMLVRLGKDFSVSKVMRIPQWCEECEQNSTYLLMFGGPGEDKKTINETYENISCFRNGRVGIVTGVRIYPNTQLHSIAIREGDLSPDTNLLQPVFYKKHYTKEELYPCIREKFANLPNCRVLGPEMKTRYD